MGFGGVGAGAGVRVEFGPRKGWSWNCDSEDLGLKRAEVAVGAGALKDWGDWDWN